jgi:hypothetical protein
LKVTVSLNQKAVFNVPQGALWNRRLSQRKPDELEDFRKTYKKPNKVRRN